MFSYHQLCCLWIYTYHEYHGLKFSGHVEKHCTNNGTRALHPETGHEWTDYSQCVNIKGFTGVVYAGVSASVISLLLLVPAVVIFLAFKPLRRQQRIQLHVSLFVSFILTSTLNVLWELLVYNDRIENPFNQTFMFKQQTACKMIYILVRYATCTNYFWMFCEGLYLHRLLLLAFQIPRHIKQYFIIGWVGPSIPVIVYFVMRLKFANDICWVKNAGGFEWVLYTPNLLCILVNLFFLLSILRILLTQLHQHPNEPSNYRRALKATFVLVPLFGLQLFLVIYRPTNNDWQNIYEIASKLIIDSQGGMIALVFCYCNGEVLTHLKSSLHKLTRKKPRLSPVTNYTVLPQSTQESSRGEKGVILNLT